MLTYVHLIVVPVYLFSTSDWELLLSFFNHDITVCNGQEEVSSLYLPYPEVPRRCPSHRLTSTLVYIRTTHRILPSSPLIDLRSLLELWRRVPILSSLIIEDKPLLPNEINISAMKEESYDAQSESALLSTEVTPPPSTLLFSSADLLDTDEVTEWVYARRDKNGRQYPQTIAHRGYKAKHPQNTMGSFHGAVTAGTHAIETDIHLSKDGVVVLSHVSSFTGSSIIMAPLTEYELGC